MTANNQMLWIDKQFGHTSLLIVMVAACFCQPFMLIFSIIGVCLCKDPIAKRNAIIILSMSGALILLQIVLIATSMMGSTP